MEHSLFTHQRDAVQFAIANNGRCAIFHSPGLGKTRTCLEIYKYHRALEPKLKLLVVCPLSLINSAWGVDIHKFTNFTYVSFKEIKGDLPDIIVINYEALISHRNLPEIHTLIRSYNFMCVIDESARLKNNKSITTKTLLNLSKFFKYRLIASGCPAPNSELELWGQMNFVNPGILHNSFYAFRNIFFHLERNGQPFIINGQFVTRQMMRDILSKGFRYCISTQNKKRLMNKISPITHWAKKEDVLDLPDKVDQIREVKFSSTERKAYMDMKRHLIVDIKGRQITAQVMLAKIMKLRTATSGFMYDKNNKAIVFGDSKIKELESTLEELGSQQVIIWAHFIYEVEKIKKMFGNKASVLYSKTQNKDASINAFKYGKVQYLIANPQSCAHGLTFINCSTQIFFSLSYSYEQYMQAKDRIHRIGQTKSCLYIHLICQESIDEELLKVLVKKANIQDLIERIINGRK